MKIFKRQFSFQYFLDRLATFAYCVRRLSKKVFTSFLYTLNSSFIYTNAVTVLVFRKTI